MTAKHRKRKRARKISHRIGDVVIVRADDLAEWMRRAAIYVGTADDGDGCSDWCSGACEAEGGPSVCAGEPGECAVYCESGELFIQAP